ncbi:DNL zinc finger domain-containing protein [Taphrina deformans PYCC 5710]|uniref:DNL zinc finger domain-containing protein n=1 Tax=Taphrina deformans (strain PYCC 5710 / ATCC 11124 / CBS 356.35 / IMI 108563 / JCM 9778 / NBRC 8474) TaxID=1097556 RepID=R4XC06_TAPDE|nr:DNL zinc finger domain-containing protein [Taphrina deformans PYCC 5710]|eukprot:CCG83407.1 DNL zinc finger domain-containing protein [Taphrina deformans PYCC 5710]
MTKQAYTKGTVLIQCPSCKNRHLIADNLKIFSDTNINIEDILREKGESIEKGNVHEGDLEFLPDDATTSEEQKALS